MRQQVVFNCAKKRDLHLTMEEDGEEMLNNINNKILSDSGSNADNSNMGNQKNEALE